MTFTVLTTKGQIVIPSIIRKHLNLRKGMKMCVVEEGNRIVLQPMTDEYYEKSAGVLKTGGKLTQMLLEERAKEKSREEEKW